MVTTDPVPGTPLGEGGPLSPPLSPRGSRFRPSCVAWNADHEREAQRRLHPAPYQDGRPIIVSGVLVRGREEGVIRSWAAG